MLVFDHPGSVGSADIVVTEDGSLSIFGNWRAGSALTVADSPDARVEVGSFEWVVSDLTLGGEALSAGSYSVTELNALGSNAVFSGSGSILVGDYEPGGPIAHWKLDEGAGDRAFDSSVFGQDGTLLHGASWGSDDVRSSFVQFDGNDDRIMTPFTYALSEDSAFTWAFWANRQSVGDGDKNAIIVGNRYGGTGSEALEFIKLTPTKGEFRNDSNEAYDYGDVITPGWHHYTMVKQGAIYQWYVDGIAQGDPVTISYEESDLLPFNIGGDDDDNVAGGRGGEHFEGFIDDVILYDRALDLAEINEVMTASSEGPPASPIEQWRARYFGSPDDIGEAQSTADPNQDGETNLVEFATNQDPHANTLISTSMGVGDDMVQFRYTRSKAAVAAGISLTVQWSGSLRQESWSSDGISESIESETEDEEHMMALIPRNSSSPQFIRLKFSN